MTCVYQEDEIKIKMVHSSNKLKMRLKKWAKNEVFIGI